MLFYVYTLVHPCELVGAYRYMCTPCYVIVYTCLRTCDCACVPTVCTGVLSCFSVRIHVACLYLSLIVSMYTCVCN